MKQEPTYTLVDDRVIEALDAALASISRSLSGVHPTDTASARLLAIVEQELSRLWVTGALAAKHAMHIRRSELSQEQRDAADAYFERYLASHVLLHDTNP